MNRIGIDIGGTQLRVAAFDEGGHQLHKVTLPNNHDLNPTENLELIAQAIEQWGIEYAGIGIGAPGPADFKAGKLLNPPNLPGWEGLGLVDFFEGRLGHLALLNNDANVAGLAEARIGAGWGHESVFYFTVSTGVGGAYVYRGEIVGGANSCAGEVFNLVVNECADVRPGFASGALEEQASGTALGRIASGRFGREIDTPELFSLATAGDELAREVVDRGAEVLARAVHNVCCVVDPDIFVFGGSVALYNPWFIDLVHEKAAETVLNPQALTFALAQCGADAGLVGASLLVP